MKNVEITKHVLYCEINPTESPFRSRLSVRKWSLLKSYAGTGEKCEEEGAGEICYGLTVIPHFLYPCATWDTGGGGGSWEWRNEFWPGKKGFGSPVVVFHPPTLFFIGNKLIFPIWSLFVMCVLFCFVFPMMETFK